MCAASSAELSNVKVAVATIGVGTASWTSGLRAPACTERVEGPASASTILGVAGSAFERFGGGKKLLMRANILALPCPAADVAASPVMRRTTLYPFLALGALLSFAACGPGAGSTGPTVPATSGSVSAAAPAPPQAQAQCARVCTVQTRCGGDKATCITRCLPIARVLLAEVIEAMVSCAESKASPKCVEGEAAASERRKLIGSCTIEATKTKMTEARANIELFAKAHCDRTQQCGTEGTFSISTCLGETKGAMLSTEGEQSGAIYGALRGPKVDEIAVCLKTAPCEDRKRADEELGKCLDATLAKAAEAP